MKYSIYANCQSTALYSVLKKNEIFSSKYIYDYLKPVQTINEDEAYLCENIFSEYDLIISQEIHDNYRIPRLRTSYLKALKKINSQLITFPSLYFNGYFPHMDTYAVNSILKSVHDYNIIYAYVKKMSVQETIDLILSEDFYSAEESHRLLNVSLNSLKKRETDDFLDIKVSDYIEKNYAKMKLFNQFNHPKGIVFDYIANQIFKLLSINQIEESMETKTPLDNSVIIPIYKSTYKNLNLSFKENFTLYSVSNRTFELDEVVESFFNSYQDIDIHELELAVRKKKPFIIDMFKNNHI